MKVIASRSNSYAVSNVHIAVNQDAALIAVREVRRQPHRFEYQRGAGGSGKPIPLL
jgi:hypothetical protein